MVRDISQGNAVLLKPPGGTIEPTETPREALARELFEEIGLKNLLIPNEPAFVQRNVAIFVIRANNKTAKDLHRGSKKLPRDRLLANIELEDVAALFPCEIDLDQIVPFYRHILGAALAA